MQVLLEVRTRLGEGLVGDLTESTQRLHRIGDSVLFIGEMFDEWRKFGKHSLQCLVAAGRDRHQPISGVDGASELAALRVELCGKGIQPSKEIPDRLSIS